VVPTAVEAFLGCGRPEAGFARLKWRAALFAEKLADELLAPVPHRHDTFTVPVALRGLFRRDRRLLGLLARSACDAVRLRFRQRFERWDVRPDCVLSLQTAGSCAANRHPHGHTLISEQRVEAHDTQRLERLAR
jgi:hypothetical protein